MKDAEDILMSAYMAEVMARRMDFKPSDVLTEMICRVVKILTMTEPKLGFCFCGTCGNGKTTMLKAIQSATSFMYEVGYFQNLRGLGIKPCIRIVDARELAELSKDAKAFDEFKSEPMLAIEDMGKESAEVMTYGNSINPIMELIESRYARQRYTIITTNLTAKEIRAKYGARIADRFNEMLEVVIFPDGSYRR